MSAADLLAQGISAARAGRKEEAQATLIKVLESDDRSELAWLWLSGVYDTPAERRACLEHVLAINPANAHARRGLDLLSRVDRAPRPVPAPAAQPALPSAAFTLRLPEAHDRASAATAAPADAAALVAVAGLSTGDTVELAAPLASDPAPARPPWWKLRWLAPAAATAAAATAAAEPSAVVSPAASALPNSSEEPASSAAPLIAAPPEATISLPPAGAAASEAEEPCPYCGAATRVEQRSCPTCHKSLMVSGARREERSIALKILVGLYGLSTLGALGGGLIQIAGIATLGAAGPAEGGAGVMGLVAAAIVAVIVLIVVVLYAGFTLALWRRKVWAFILHWIGVGLNVLGTVVFVIFLLLAGGAAASTLGELPQGESGAIAGAMGAAAGILGLVALCNVGLTVAWLALTVACHGDFFGRRVRVSTAGIAMEGDPYNNGIAYRNRGMWYMAAHEWERAACAAPQDATVRRALGLAYAQLGRYDQARGELGAALALLPGNPQLADDLALVERLAKKRR